jgi:hypothetical protein
MNISETKVLGVPQPLAGALIGALLLLLITLPIKFLPTDSKPLSLMLLSVMFELWGRLPLSALSNLVGVDLPEFLSNIMVLLLSTIPPALLGWMIGSNKQAIKVTGIVLLIIYLIVTVGLGSLLILMAI